MPLFARRAPLERPWRLVGRQGHHPEACGARAEAASTPEGEGAIDDRAAPGEDDLENLLNLPFRLRPCPSVHPTFAAAGDLASALEQVDTVVLELNEANILAYHVQGFAKALGQLTKD